MSGRGAGSGCLLAAGTVAVAVTALAGCAQFDSALGQRQAVVTFTDSATLAQRMAVRTACAKPPNVTPQPLPSNLKSAYELPQVIYQINKASRRGRGAAGDVPGQVPLGGGVTLQDSSDEGN